MLQRTLRNRARSPRRNWSLANVGSRHGRIGACALVGGLASAVMAVPASGPLTVHPTNPRYFADATGKAIYLTGSHTWTNLQETWSDSFTIVFDYDEYLDFLQQHHHNFIRMWREELPKFKLSSSEFRYSTPHPWKIVSGGGTIDPPPPGAGDGDGPDPGSGGLGGHNHPQDTLPPPVPGAKYDLEQFNQVYFDRLRERVSAANERGIYVSIMLFEGYGLQFSTEGWAWHPFNAGNNINGVNGDQNGDGIGTEIHTMQIPAVTAVQEAYVRKVIDTVNDLDNVLFEIANESIAGSIEWQNHFVDFVHQYEAGKPQQHPVLFTTPFPYSGNDLWESNAEAISPGAASSNGSYADNPPPADGSKVVMLDSDHIFGCGQNVPWIWKSFARGMNVLYMDSYYDDTPFCTPPSEDMRVNLGYTNDYAQRMILSSTTPQGALASTGYCLANPGVSYLVYAPSGGTFTLDLSAATQSLNVEWFNRTDGTATTSGTVQGGGVQSFSPPFGGDAVLFVFDPDAAPPPPPPPGNTVGDLDGDGVVNLADLLILVNAWGACPTPPDPCIADLSGNGTVGLEDLLILLNHWSATTDKAGGATAPAQPTSPPAKQPKTNPGKTKSPPSDDSGTKKPAGTKAPEKKPSPASPGEAAFIPVGWPFVPSAWNPKIVDRRPEGPVQQLSPYLAGSAKSDK